MMETATTRQGVILDTTIAVLQINLRTTSGVLPSAAWEEAEILGEASPRRPSVAGMRLFASRSSRTSFVEFANDLGQQGYTLAHVGCRSVPREFGSDQRVLRYTFGQHPPEDVELQELGIRLTAELEEYAAAALFSVSCWKNPFMKDGVPIPGRYAISIDISDRCPLRHESGPKEGEIVMVWSGGRDLKKSGIGEKVPLAPTDYLSADQGVVELVAASEFDLVTLA